MCRLTSGEMFISPHAPLITGRILLLILGILILSTWTTHVVKSQKP
uniref:Fimbrial adapter PapF n=1 Tax=Escherichia coli TaxID=562 RepID=A0A499WLP2_ECOLX|nr:fimbrial adapter PapF [Escherichia coli]